MLRNFIWSFLEQSGTKTILLVVQIVLARLLDPEAFGILAILLVLTNVADVIAQSGLGMALVQKQEASSKDFSTAFWLSLGFSTVLCTGIWVVAPIASMFYGEPSLCPYLQVMSFVVVFNSANSIQRAYLQRGMGFKELTKSNVIGAVLSGIVGIIFAFAGAGVWALIAQVLAQSVITCAVLFVVVPWKPRFEFDASSAKSMYSYGWKICVTSVLNVLYSGVSELVIGRTCSVSDLGLYSQGRKWPNAAVGIASNALQNVFFPMFSSLRREHDLFIQSVRRSLVSGSFITVPLAFFFIVFAEPVILLLFGETWVDCVPIFQATCLSGSLTLLQIVNLRAYMALGDSGLYLKLQVFKVVLSVFAIGGAAICTRNIYIVAGVTAVSAILCILVIDLNPAKRMIGYSRLAQLKDIFPIYALSVVASLVSTAVRFIPIPGPFVTVFAAGVFTLVYLGASAVFRVEGFEDCMAVARRILRRAK